MSSGPNERRDYEDTLPPGCGTLNWLAVFSTEFVHPNKGRLKATVFFSAPGVASANQLTMVTVAGDDALLNSSALVLTQSLAGVRFYAGPSAATWRRDILASLHHVNQVIIGVRHVRLISDL